MPLVSALSLLVLRLVFGAALLFFVVVLAFLLRRDNLGSSDS